MGAEQSGVIANAGPETNGAGAVQAQLPGVVAGLAVEHAVASGAGPGAEELPDVENHPRIQPNHTMGDGHDYYPLTATLATSIQML